MKKTIAAKTTRRPQRDPRAAILAAFDRIVANPEHGRAEPGGTPNNLASHALQDVLEELFVTDNWPTEACVALLHAIVENAPAGDLPWIAEEVEQSETYWNAYAAGERYARLTGQELPDEFDVDAFRRALAGEDAASDVAPAPVAH